MTEEAQRVVLNVNESMLVDLKKALFESLEKSRKHPCPYNSNLANTHLKYYELRKKDQCSFQSVKLSIEVNVVGVIDDCNCISMSN